MCSLPVPLCMHAHTHTRSFVFKQAVGVLVPRHTWCEVHGMGRRMIASPSHCDWQTRMYAGVLGVELKC